MIVHVGGAELNVAGALANWNIPVKYGTALPEHYLSKEIIESLAENPRPRGAQKLSGKERYRIRQGRYRILYSIHDQELVVYVIRSGDRKSVYRNL